VVVAAVVRLMVVAGAEAKLRLERRLLRLLQRAGLHTPRVTKASS